MASERQEKGDYELGGLLLLLAGKISSVRPRPIPTFVWREFKANISFLPIVLTAHAEKERKLPQSVARDTLRGECVLTSQFAYHPPPSSPYVAQPLFPRPSVTDKQEGSSAGRMRTYGII